MYWKHLSQVVGGVVSSLFSLIFLSSFLSSYIGSIADAFDFADKMFQKLKPVHIWDMHGNAAKDVLRANNTEIFANGDSGEAGTDIALGGPRPVQAGFF